MKKGCDAQMPHQENWLNPSHLINNLLEAVDEWRLYPNLMNIWR